MTGVPDDSDPVGDDVRLFRRITEHHVVAAPEEPLGMRISSAAFQPSSEDFGISVSIEDTMNALGMEPADLMVLMPPSVGLTYLSARQVRAPEIGKEIERKPTGEDPSHGNLVGPDSTARRKRLARLAQAQWVVEPS